MNPTEFQNYVSTFENTLKSHKDKIADLEGSMKTFSANVSNQITALSIGGAVTGQGGDHAKNIAAMSVATGKKFDAESYTAYRQAVNRYLREGLDVLPGELRNAMSVGYEQAGGVLVTPEMTTLISQKLHLTSPMRQICAVQTISTSAIKGIVDNDEADSGWVSEIASRDDTASPDLGKWEIPLHEQYAQPKATQTLLDDAATSVETWLAGKIADKISRTENTALLTGNGSGRPRGLLDYTKVSTGDATRAWDAIQYVPTASAGAFAASNGADVLIDVVQKLKAPYRSGAVWLMNSATAGVAMKLKDGQGNYLWQPSAQAGAPDRLRGYPVVYAEDMPDIAANSYSIAFGNFASAYLIVDHVTGLRILRDPYTAKPYVRFYSTRRCGGGLINGEAVKLVKFAAS